jgi:hypothetical protein
MMGDEGRPIAPVLENAAKDAAFVRTGGTFASVLLLTTEIVILAAP